MFALFKRLAICTGFSFHPLRMRNFLSHPFNFSLFSLSFRYIFLPLDYFFLYPPIRNLSNPFFFYRELKKIDQLKKKLFYSVFWTLISWNQKTGKKNGFPCCYLFIYFRRFDLIALNFSIWWKGELSIKRDCYSSRFLWHMPLMETTH